MASIPIRRRWQHLRQAADRSIDRNVWSPLARFADVIHPAPLLSGLIIFVLLATIGQLHEIYLSYLEPPYDFHRVRHVALAGAALALLSATLFLANYWFSEVERRVLWSERRDLPSDRLWRAWRNVSGILVAALPWIGVGYGLWQAYRKVEAHAKGLNDTAHSFADPLPEAHAVLDSLRSASSGPYWTLFVVGAAGSVVLLVLHLNRRSKWMRRAAFGLVALLLVAALVVPRFMDSGVRGGESVELFRAIGPLAMIVIDALLVFACVALLSWLAREERIPVLTLVVVVALVASFFTLDVFRIANLTAILFLIIALLALVSRRRPLFAFSAIVLFLSIAVALRPGPGDMTLDIRTKHEQQLLQRYDAWLKAHEDARLAYARARPNTDYPVFIIAAEGGGIYAAAAASTFLSRLQELCPSFAQHVFAISGVSGGAVGAAVFQSNIQSRPVSGTGCVSTDARPPDRISAKSAQVIQEDHLSPLLGFVVADLLGTFDDRSGGLERSLERANAGLKAPFESHWHPERAAPALVLNATWVETGHRVAFAPFGFGKLAGGTLFSFLDVPHEQVRALSLAEAAVVSARFPAILPPFTLARQDRRWNFVDGGYKDSSGALTALDIFNAIEDVSTKNKVKLRVILLTSARATLNPSQVGGTTARDLLGPLLTLLSVRDQLAEDAVIRTIAAIDGGNAESLRLRSSPPQRGTEDEWKATLVELDAKNFALPLGWKISKSNSRHSVVADGPSRSLHAGEYPQDRKIR